MKKIIDSFTFFNELNILKLRLNYLKDVVDYFLICECSHTFTANPKPYYLDEVIDELDEDIRKKIIRIKYEVDGRNYYNDQWRLEHEQRNFISQNLTNFSPDDIIMVGDVDEIPRKEKIVEIFNKWDNNSLFALKYEAFIYNFNTFIDNNWYATVLSSVKQCAEKGSQWLRDERINLDEIENGGWHFTYFGDVQKIKLKINSFSHQEVNIEKYTNDLHILDSIKNKKCYYDTNISYSNYNFNNYPKDLRELISNIFPKEYFNEV
jgi:beta-1,4-mannosyl-glycoprotein beta-1,4-N-acetylglucosaminyltransferase